MNYYRVCFANGPAQRFFKLSVLLVVWQFCGWTPLRALARQDEQVQAPTAARVKMTEPERWKLKFTLSTLAVTLIGVEWFCARRLRRHARSATAARQRFVVAVLHRSTPRRSRSSLDQSRVGWEIDA